MSKKFPREIYDHAFHLEWWGYVIELRVNLLFKIIGQEADFTFAQGKRFIMCCELLIFKNNSVWLRLWMFVITHWILFTFAQILMWPTGKQNIINFYNNKHVTTITIHRGQSEVYSCQLLFCRHMKQTRCAKTTLDTK